MRPGKKPFALHYQLKNSPAAQWMACIRRAAVPVAPPAPLEGPLAVEITFYLTRPKSKSKKVIWPIVKPDLDNLIKPFMDALEGVIFRRDAQVVEQRVAKHYSARPRAEVKIREIKDDNYPEDFN
jgi:Holliday junction resolvase RusA-like endonuclease